MKPRHIASVLALSMAMPSPLFAQAQASRSDIRERQSLAESIASSRETASGLNWDASFRASFTSRLSALSLDTLRGLNPEGDFSPVLGGTGVTDQVFTPVRPCRFVDGIQANDRVSTSANATTARFYRVRGSNSTDFISQGAAASAPDGCGIPTAATAVVINLTVADPDNDGDLKVDPAHLSASTTSTLNYTFGGVRGKNLANGITVQLCDLSASTCASGSTPTSATRDIRVTFHSGALAHTTFFLADVVGYYSRPQQPELGTVKAAAHINGIVGVGVVPSVSRCFVITSATTATSTCTPGTTVTVTRLSAGQYVVDFGFDVSTRYYSATAGASASGVISTGQGPIDVSPRAGNVNAVLVQTFNTAGAALDTQFFIQIF
jgi:hypothetical protein